MESTPLPTMYELCLLQIRADRAMRAVISQQLEFYDLDIMEWIALGAISSNAKYGFGMSEVAVILGVSLPQVTALATHLQESKFIRQEVLLSDRRGRQLIITPKGKRALMRLEELVAAALRTWIKNAPGKQFQDYIHLLDRRSKRTDQAAG